MGKVIYFSKRRIELTLLFSHKIFKNLGPLTAYLLTVDLCYAEVVTEPKIEEMGPIIRNIDCGSYAKLVELQIFDPRTNDEELGHAFKRFYEGVCSAMTEDEHQRWKFTPFTMEHTNCKQGRLKGFF